MLRFSENDADTAPITILTIYPDNLVRNLTQWRTLIVGGGDIRLLKPRYYRKDGHLRLAPLLELEYGVIDQFFADPARFLKHENFLPDSEFGPYTVRFPYSLVVARMAIRLFQLVSLEGPIKRGFIGFWPRWTKLNREQSVKLVETVTTITKYFNDECVRRQKRCFVVLLPDEASIIHFKENSASLLEPIRRRILSMGIDVLDLTSAFIKNTTGSKGCDLIGKNRDCRGHYNETGYFVVAKSIYGHLIANKEYELRLSAFMNNYN